MNKQIIILAFLFSFATAQAQTQPVTDTLAYLKSIEARKAEFVGQPFSKLLNELKINIIKFGPIGSNSNDITQEPTTVFRFKRPIASQDYLDFPSISIYWHSYIDIDLSTAIATQTSVYGKWTDSAKLYYQNFIIDDIIVDGKNPPPPPRWVVTSCVYKKVKLEDGLYYFRYVVTKQLCTDGVLGTETEVTYSTTSVPTEGCMGAIDVQ
ncbi:MAG: hypothetical protein BGN92_01090 [Sphingobacteriales bacterium 41-5]|nr:MAG: hypothetical protein BGN92_01090 [Sphingobacteriales bacterium 41-5]